MNYRLQTNSIDLIQQLWFNLINHGKDSSVIPCRLTIRNSWVNDKKIYELTIYTGDINYPTVSGHSLDNIQNELLNLLPDYLKDDSFVNLVFTSIRALMQTYLVNY